MPLVHTNNTGIYAGVSKQAIDLRLPNHCEEMINCYPSIQNGTRRRNPTQQISSAIFAEDNQFMHTYDRGLSGETLEQYVVTIDASNGLRVYDVYSNEYRTVSYSGNALRYLESSNPEIGFAAITIKDSTFIVNRDVIPRRQGEIAATVNYSLLTVDLSGYSKKVITNIKNITILSLFANIGTTSTYLNLAPARIKEYDGGSLVNGKVISSVGATTTVTVDGKVVNYTVKTINDGYNIYPESMSEYRMNLASTLLSSLGNTYKVTVDTLGKVYVYDLSGTAIITTTSISFPASVTTPPPALSSFSSANWTLASEANNGSNPIVVTGGTSTEFVGEISDYDKQAFIWIKQVSVDTAFPYTFTVTLKESNGTTISTTSTSSTTANGVATAIKNWANGLADFTSVSEGSVTKITRDSGSHFDIVISDTFGSQASSVFKGSTDEMADLPKSFPYKDTIVKIDGVNRTDTNAYWVKYDGNQWIEWRDPNMLSSIDADSMPHQLTRNSDFTFTLQPVVWEDIMVGDEDSQTIPEFIGNPIRDLFFVGGRFGILTANGISLSEQGKFQNFFRTTVLSLLDDSAISTYIDSSSSVGLEYAVELQSSIVIFGDKKQFALDASKPITPSSISVQPISGFEINKNVKPISSGDSVFFLVSKSGYSSLMEMNKTTISMNIRANDVSSHVPNYISSDIMQIVSSQRDNVVFLRSRSEKDTIYVYKHYGTETEKMQMAWSKWQFGMNIKSIFVFDKNLYLFGLRYDSAVPLDEFTFATVWDDSKDWIDESYWVDGEVLATPSFELLDIDSYNNDALFEDLGMVRYNSSIELSQWSLSDKKDKKELRGSLLMKTIQISSADDSNFYLVVEDKERNTSRSIPSVYTVNRKPFISGNSKNMRLSIVSNDGDGFQINSISIEGQYNVRSRRT